MSTRSRKRPRSKRLMHTRKNSTSAGPFAGPTYLDAARITGKKQTDAPLSRSQTGYGSKEATSWLLQLDGKKWYRVYVMIYSNSGSAYVIVNGKNLFLGSYEPSYNSPDESARIAKSGNLLRVGSYEKVPSRRRMGWM